MTHPFRSPHDPSLSSNPPPPAGTAAPAPTPASAVSPPASPPPAPTRFDQRFFLRIALQILGVVLAGVALLVLVGLAQRFGGLDADVSAPAAGAAEDVVYTCPMHPQIRQSTPGRCPICGMELVVAASATQADQDQFAVHIEPAARRLANIQTAVVEERPVVRTISTVGRIAADESRLATISAYVGGRLERLFADYTGVEVARGDHLAVIYTPTLYAAQVEYVESRRSLREMNQATLAAVRTAQQRLVENARQRLVELGMTAEQITELERTGESQSRLTIYAPIGGTVTEKLAVEGNYVEAGEPIYRIADLSLVWLMLQLYPEDAAAVRFGQEVEAEVQSLPDQMFTGRVAFVSPTVDEQTRTVAVRVEMANADGKLRPGDYARARITVPLATAGEVYDANLAGKWISPMHPQIVRDDPGQCPICGMDLVPTSQYGFADEPVPQPQALVVPRDAVLMAGQNSVVYVETEPGRFEIRPVQLGPITGETAVILSGVEAGEKVARSGNFLIDSQMQLSGKPSLIDPTRATKSESKPTEGPLDSDEIEIQPIAGAAGSALEALYQAYFPVQQRLASDQTVTEEQAQTLRARAQAVTESQELPAAYREHAAEIAAAAEHLHHMDLKNARERFKTISRHITLLAFSARGTGAEQPILHFYCPMVKGGGGDWLQSGGELANPYYGSEMLRCGELVHTLPPAEPAKEQL